MTSLRTCCCIGHAILLLAIGIARGNEAPTTDPTKLPHIQINLEKKHIDLEAKVVLRQADWLELLACSPGSREHESILTIPAKPSHIHLALVMIGLEPGAPMKWRTVDKRIEVDAARGPKVAVFIVTQVDGKEKETPANQWIIHQESKKPLDGNIWLFTGSGFAEWDGKRIYRADANGTILSLVHFGDDLLARPTEMTHQNDNAAWGANTDAVPAEGTAVTVRLKKAEEPPKSK